MGTRPDDLSPRNIVPNACLLVLHRHHYILEFLEVGGAHTVLELIVLDNVAIVSYTLSSVGSSDPSPLL